MSWMGWTDKQWGVAAKLKPQFPPTALGAVKLRHQWPRFDGGQPSENGEADMKWVAALGESLKGLFK